MAPAGEPVGTGLVASLARPGGNVTGMSAATAELAGKSLELVRETIPSARRIGVLANESDPLAKPFLEQIDQVLAPLASRSIRSWFGRSRRSKGHSTRCAARRSTPLWFKGGLQRKELFDLAIKYRLPVVLQQPAGRDHGRINGICRK
ncbi:MAG: hypothetical protein QOK44_3830 [Betaproteobacteria bacterium]|jgi:putative ABC transport system substrate-binding protein|nr:hypothetical protein [Betaproteobacteria bacterium]